MSNTQKQGKAGRFAFSKRDPRWQRDVKGKNKIRIDPRFGEIFTDPGFTLDSTVDKYGRKVEVSAKQLYTKLYELEDESEKGDNEQTSDKMLRPETTAEEEEEEEEVEEEESEKSSGDEKEEEEGREELAEKIQNEENYSIELENNQEAVELGEATTRIAVQNCDWDHLRAVDLMVLLQSFVPSAGAIQAVTVYPSFFGLERQKEEAAHGPKCVWADDDNPDGAEFDPDKLRQYELEKLRYYFAVVICDSTETADAIYTSCDGMEFERTGNKLDLRFIPADVSFTQSPRDAATAVPSNYKPPNFYTKALQHSRVDLTWDKTDPRREEKILKTKFSTDELKMNDFRAYLASSSESSDESEDEWEEIVIDKEGESKAKRMKKNQRAKYASLLGEMQKDDEMQDMEITFTSGLTDQVEDLVEQVKRNKEEDGESVFHKQLRAIKEKKKKKKQDMKKETIQASDDELLGQPEQKSNPPTDQSSKKKKYQKASNGNQAQDDQERKNLELLVMEENLSKATQKPSPTSLSTAGNGGTKTSSRKKKTKKNKKAEEDFNVDLEDTRFVGIINSPDFALDPTRQVTNKSLAAKLKVIQNERMRKLTELAAHQKPAAKQEGPAKDLQLANLVDSVKRKAAGLRKAEPAKKKQRITQK